MPVVELDLKSQKPLVTTKGKDLTILASGHSSHLVREAIKNLNIENIFPEVIDVRILSPLYIDDIIASVKKTENFWLLTLVGYPLVFRLN